MLALKKQPLLDITNSTSDRNERIKKHCTGAVYDMLPIAFPNKLSSDSIDCTISQRLLCRNNMRHSKQAKTWFWICTRRVNGKKCNIAKFSVRRGTFFDNSKLSIQSILRIVWNFVHHLSEEQCKQFVGISTKTNHTVGEYYCDFRNTWNHWIRDPRNLAKLGVWCYCRNG